MNVREAINFGLNKLNFEDIRENQRKVAEAYLSGRDVLMISPTGSPRDFVARLSDFVIHFSHKKTTWGKSNYCAGYVHQMHIGLPAD